MAITNFDHREIVCKIVYFGAAQAGKTANLRSLCRILAPEIRAGLFDIGDDANPTPLEFLPLSLGYVKDYHLKVHLHTFEPMPFMPVLASTILRGIDGYVFVCNAEASALEANLKSMQMTESVLKDEGYILSELPRVVQYNKMDKDKVVPLAILREGLNSRGTLDCESIATNSTGTLETLQLIVQQCLRLVAVSEDLKGLNGGLHVN